MQYAVKRRPTKAKNFGDPLDIHFKMSYIEIVGAKWIASRPNRNHPPRGRQTYMLRRSRDKSIYAKACYDSRRIRSIEAAA